MNKLKALWSQLPHSAQGAIVAFTAASAGVLINFYSDPHAWSPAEFRHELVTALAAGFGALRVFFMLPNTPPTIIDQAHIDAAKQAK